MDLATLVGLVVCAGMVIMGIVTGDEGVAALGNFVDGFLFHKGLFKCT